jgi:hypothetical protein
VICRHQPHVLLSAKRDTTFHPSSSLATEDPLGAQCRLHRAPRHLRACRALQTPSAIPRQIRGSSSQLIAVSPGRFRFRPLRQNQFRASRLTSALLLPAVRSSQRWMVKHGTHKLRPPVLATFQVCRAQAKRYASLLGCSAGIQQYSGLRMTPPGQLLINQLLPLSQEFLVDLPQTVWP